MITRQESHCGTCAFFKRDSNMYEIQYQQLSSCSKSMVRSYLKGSLFFFFKYSSFWIMTKDKNATQSILKQQKHFHVMIRITYTKNHRCHIRTKQNRTKITLYTKKLEHKSTNYSETPGRFQWATICSIITKHISGVFAAILWPLIDRSWERSD